ncbi:MAG: MFS transporter [Duncaniella sp.]|uniref:MFS transporter n=1 Tax=Duncaniella sp. TaxID=2518496 RepID=UPI0019C6EE8F|nr:MFS transporter [Duncaniella sp.]MBD5335246.1 sugar MFS transporter [Bacteroides sp.]MDE6090226.1 MFS transporter [Duncaniella sp.]
METTAKNNARIVAIVVMFFIYAMISFVTNLAAPIGTIWGYQFEGNSVLGMMGNMMNFLAYLFMGIPAGNMLVRIGYKKTALWALAVGVVGLFVQFLSSSIGTDTVVTTFASTNAEGVATTFPITLNFFIYLLGAFICGFCVCMLNTVVNPMLNLLGGGGNRGNQLLQFGGALNSLSGTLTPLFVGMLIGVLSSQTQIGDVNPLLFIGMGIFSVAFVILCFVSIPEPNMSNGKKVKYAHSPWNFRHTVLGVIGIFFYVGIEIGIPGTLNFYLADQSANGAGVEGQASAIAGAIVAVYWLFMLIGRTLSGFISGSVSSRTQLIAVSTTAIILIILAIFIPKTTTFPVPEMLYEGGAQVPVSAFLLILCGLCTSIMWGGIFNLAVEGLGKYTAQASGIFMMMVVGGGVMPLIQNAIAKSCGYMPSYWLVVAMLAYLLYYGLIGSKNVNTDIPVEEETPDPLNL